MMLRGKSRRERSAAVRFQRFYAEEGHVVPITREQPRYLEPTPDAATRKNKGSGSDNRGMVNRFHKSSAGSSDGRVRRPPRDARARSRRQGGDWACVCRATATRRRRRVALQIGFGKDIDDAYARRIRTPPTLANSFATSCSGIASVKPLALPPSWGLPIC